MQSLRLALGATLRLVKRAKAMIAAAVLMSVALFGAYASENEGRGAFQRRESALAASGAGAVAP